MTESTPEQRLTELGIELPPTSSPAGGYVPARLSGTTLYVSGQGPAGAPPSTPVIGKVGSDLTLEQGREAARQCGLNLLAVLRAELGTLDRVAAVLKLVGFVNAAPGFNQMPAVIDGVSNLLVDVFGERGRHARSAVGMAELPFDIAVETELIVETA
jgi:enamine deaminase RidA (YjgF/YER057c/UK114 family)